MTDLLELWDKIKSEEYNHEEPKHGISGSVYLTEDYVFKNKDADEISKINRVVNRLENHGVNVPTVELCSEDDNLIVFHRINGSVLKDLNDPTYLIGTHVGETLSEIHGIEFSTFGDIQGGSSDSEIQGEFPSLEKYVEEVIRKTDDFIHVSSDFRDGFEVAKKMARDSSIDSRRSSICHYDYCAKNIIIKDEQAYAIDFELCELGLPGADLVHAYLQMKHSYSEEFIEGFFQGYGRTLEDVSNIELALGVLWECGCGSFMERNLEYDKRRASVLYEFLDQVN